MRVYNPVQALRSNPFIQFTVRLDADGDPAHGTTHFQYSGLGGTNRGYGHANDFDFAHSLAGWLGSVWLHTVGENVQSLATNKMTYRRATIEELPEGGTLVTVAADEVNDPVLEQFEFEGGVRAVFDHTIEELLSNTAVNPPTGYFTSGEALY